MKVFERLKKKKMTFGNIENGNHQTTKMKKITKGYLKRMRKHLEIYRCSRNLIKRINTWAVFVLRYSGPFLKWSKEELGQGK